MKLRDPRIIAGTMALAAATTIAATAGGAFADEPPGGIVWDHTYSATGVKVYVEEHGDIISVCDTSTNGHSAWVAVYDLGGHDGAGYSMTVTNGSGSCKTHQAADGVPYDLTEGSTINLQFEGNGAPDTGYSVASFVNDH